MRERADSETRLHRAPTGVLRIVIVDDHPIVAKGLAELIDNERDMTVCGQETTVAGGLQLIQKSRPDVAVVDWSLGLGSGLELVKQLAGSHQDVRVLMLSVHDETLYAERALAAGAHGYVMKDEPVTTVIGAVRAVARGKTYVSRQMSQRIVSRLAARGAAQVPTEPLGRLTDREREVFALIGRGLTTRGIAQQLGLSVKTVETYRSRIKDKLDLTRSAALVRAAVTWAEG
jgi:DNA-binding NarL/FixJ family response regulator